MVAVAGNRLWKGKKLSNQRRKDFNAKKRYKDDLEKEVQGITERIKELENK